MSSQGDNENPAATIANRRNERGILVFRHYVMEYGLGRASISTDEPGEGPPFAQKRPHEYDMSPWYERHAPSPEDVLRMTARDALERKRRFAVQCMSLPSHI